MFTTEITGVPITVGTEEELFMMAKELIGKGGRIATPNPETLSLALADRALRSALVSADLSLPDGRGLRSALRALGADTDLIRPEKLGEKLLTGGELRLGLIGSTPGTAEAAMNSLRADHPNVTAAFSLGGSFVTEERIGKLIGETKPDLVYVGLGTPRQELLAMRLSFSFPSVLFLTVGDALDVYAGKKKPTPGWMRDLSLGWLFRAVREPKKLPSFFLSLRFFRAAGKEAKRTQKLYKKTLSNYRQSLE